ncbi:MAG: phage major capsid protein [candidate division WOR-3 bacterium]
MTDTVISLRQQRAKILEDMREALSANNVEAFDALSKKEDEIASLIQRHEHVERLANEQAAKWVEENSRGGKNLSHGEQMDFWRALRTHLLYGDNALTPEMRAVLTGSEVRTISTTPSTAGGYLIAPDFMAEIVMRMKDYTPMFSVCRIVSTNTGTDMPVPTFDGTSLLASIVAESGAIGITTLQFNQVIFKAYKYAAMLRTTWEMLQDSAFDLQTFMRDVLAEMFGRKLAVDFTSGNGTSEPQGFITGATTGHTLPVNNAITRQDILSLIHSLDPAYRRSPSCALMLSDSLLRSIKALQIGSNDASPLWQPSMRDGEPDRIDGIPYYVNQAMDGLGAADKTVMAIGDWSRFAIRSVKEMTYQPLNELYAANGQVAIVAHARFDSRVLDNQAIKLLKTPV